jgi:hypothetical protein
MANEKRLIQPCEICEMYVKGETCEQTNCPVAKLKAENERLKVDNAKLDTELKLLKQELQHKDELLELHKFYRKLIPNN